MEFGMSGDFYFCSYRGGLLATSPMDVHKPPFYFVAKILNQWMFAVGMQFPYIPAVKNDVLVPLFYYRFPLSCRFPISKTCPGSIQHKIITNIWDVEIIIQQFDSILKDFHEKDRDTIIEIWKYC